MSASPYQPAPQPGAPAALVDGRKATSWWPDRRPPPTRRQQVWSLVGALGLFLAPFVVDLVGGPPWRSLWLLSAFGVAFAVQAGMDAARPPADDRFAVVLYRSVHVLLPLAVAYLVLLFGWPAIFEV